MLGMYYAKARMYDAENRRFAAVDPVKGEIVNPMTMVQYLYVVDNPLRWVDLLGLSYDVLILDGGQPVGNHIDIFPDYISKMVNISIDKLVQSSETMGESGDAKNALVQANIFIKYGQPSTGKISARVDIKVTTVKSEEDNDLWFGAMASVVSAWEPLLGVIYAAAKDSTDQTVEAGASAAIEIINDGTLPYVSDALNWLSAVSILEATTAAMTGYSNPNYHIFISSHNDNKAVYGNYIFDPNGQLLESYGVVVRKLPPRQYYKNVYCPGKGTIDAYIGKGINGNSFIEKRYEY